MCIRRHDNSRSVATAGATKSWGFHPQHRSQNGLSPHHQYNAFAGADGEPVDIGPRGIYSPPTAEVTTCEGPWPRIGSLPAVAAIVGLVPIAIGCGVTRQLSRAYDKARHWLLIAARRPRQQPNIGSDDEIIGLVASPVTRRTFDPEKVDMKGFEDDRYYVPKDDAMQLIGTPSALAQWRHLGRGPRYIKYGKRILYLGKDLNNWLAEHAVEPTDWR